MIGDEEVGFGSHEVVVGRTVGQGTVVVKVFVTTTTFCSVTTTSLGGLICSAARDPATQSAVNSREDFILCSGIGFFSALLSSGFLLQQQIPRSRLVYIYIYIYIIQGYLVGGREREMQGWF